MSDDIDSVTLATELTIAWLGNSNTRASAEDVPAFLQSMHAAVSSLSTGSAETAPAADEPAYEPAVSSRKSLANPDFILSMIDGKPYRALKRHLTTNGITPDQYRERYGLKSDYPMVAPSYSEARRAMAHKIGLGSKGRQAKAAQPAAPAKPGRKPRAAKASENGSTEG